MDRKTLQELIVHLKKGEVALVPFDTCYGLVCDGTNPQACTRLYQLKQRPRFIPSALVLAEVEQIEEYALMSAQQRRILKRLLPGKVTAILRLKPDVDLPSGFIKTKYGTASFRVIKSNTINEIIKALKKPLLATSANVHKEPVILSKTDYIMHPFNLERSEKVYLLMDEIFERPSHSTVIDLTTDKPEIIREGAVPNYEIEHSV